MTEQPPANWPFRLWNGQLANPPKPPVPFNPATAPEAPF